MNDDEYLVLPAVAAARLAVTGVVLCWGGFAEGTTNSIAQHCKKIGGKVHGPCSMEQEGF